MRLAHVLEEGSRQDREMEFDMENDEKDSQEADPDTYFQELARIGHYGRREQKRPGHG